MAISVIHYSPVKRIISFVAIVMLFIGANNFIALSQEQTKSGSKELKTGGSRMITIDGKYRVWTKRVGSGKIKVLTLHGGPGFTHEYLECFEDFLPKEGIEFYYYDQLGCGNSDQSEDTTLWNIDRYREEVEQVRSALGLENFYLYGQSWGGMLAIEYALKYQQHLKGLIISDMTAGMKAYTAYAKKLRSQLPQDAIAILDKYEGAGQYDAPEYQETIMKTMYAQHVIRLDPWPEPVERSFRHFNQRIYNIMQGPNEFVITGNFKNWERWDDLPSIKVPTLVICGQYDEMNPDDIKREGSLIPHSRAAICENGSHLCMWDDQETYFKHLIAFLKDVEKKQF
jgi:proline iminopeptidase